MLLDWQAGYASLPGIAGRALDGGEVDLLWFLVNEFPVLPSDDHLDRDVIEPGPGAANKLLLARGARVGLRPTFAQPPEVHQGRRACRADVREGPDRTGHFDAILVGLSARHVEVADRATRFRHDLLRSPAELGWAHLHEVPLSDVLAEDRDVGELRATPLHGGREAGHP